MAQTKPLAEALSHMAEDISQVSDALGQTFPQSPALFPTT